METPDVSTVDSATAAWTRSVSSGTITVSGESELRIEESEFRGSIDLGGTSTLQAVGSTFGQQTFVRSGSTARFLHSRFAGHTHYLTIDAGAEVAVEQSTFDPVEEGTPLTQDYGGAARNRGVLVMRGTTLRGIFSYLRGGRQYHYTYYGRGGAIYNEAGGQATLVDCRFRDCKTAGGSGSYGGALHNAGGTMVVRSCSFEGCHSQYGGTVYNTGELNMSDCSIRSGFADGDGGAIHQNGGTLRLTHCNISGAAAHSGVGGAVRAAQGTLLMEDCLLNASSAGSDGGGLYVDDVSTVTVHGGRFLSNVAADEGGGAYIEAGGARVEIADCDFVGNEAGDTSRGDGLFLAELVPSWVQHVVNNTMATNLQVPLVDGCGDGEVSVLEECDDGSDGNSNATSDACRPDCTAARCGDGVVDSGEDCDDGDVVHWCGEFDSLNPCSPEEDDCNVVDSSCRSTGPGHHQCLTCARTANSEAVNAACVATCYENCTRRQDCAVNDDPPVMSIASPPAAPTCDGVQDVSALFSWLNLRYIGEYFMCLDCNATADADMGAARVGANQSVTLGCAQQERCVWHGQLRVESGGVLGLTLMETPDVSTVDSATAAWT
eukprot:SAG22_NODE_1102_length_5560_cov_44.363120_1_plen_604_part_10